MYLRALKTSVIALALSAPLLAGAETGIYVQGGTLGIGGGVGYGVNDALTARIGYTTLKIEHDFHTDDVDYKGKFKLGGAQAMLDWFPFSGIFRVTGGVVIDHNKVDVDAKLNHSPIVINGVPYDVNNLAAINGEAKFKTTVPYLGIGWGNAASSHGKFHFMADIGVEYLGSPKVKLHGSCAAQFQSNPMCTQFMSDLAAEEKNINKDVEDYKWWPVINIGLAYRF